METATYVLQVQSQLVTAAALGNDSARQTAEALADAAEPAVRLAILAAVSAAADEITAALLDFPEAPAVSIRLDGNDLRVDVRATEPHPTAPAVSGGPDDADNSARISLRLPDVLKTQIEAAARTNAVSVNTWIVRAAAAALSGPAQPARTAVAAGARITGWISG